MAEPGWLQAAVPLDPFATCYGAKGANLEGTAAALLD